MSGKGSGCSSWRAWEWPYKVHWWGNAIGVLLLGIVFSLTPGSIGVVGMGAALFNLAEILLVAVADAAGMSYAFPVGVGLTLVTGMVCSYL